MATYEKAFETHVYQEDKWVFIDQCDIDGDHDLVQLTKHQAYWLMSELQEILREDF